MRRTSVFARGIAILSVALVGRVGMSPSHAQNRPSPLSELAVDLVSLRVGPQLRGAVIGQTDGQVGMVVSREWLKGAFPTYFRKATQDEIAGVRETYTTLVQRIDAWLKEEPKQKEVRFLLESQRRRAKETLAAMGDKPSAPETQFMLLNFPAGLVKFHFVQPPTRRPTLLEAWREKLPDVETRKASDLAAELRKKNAKPPEAPIDLSERLPPHRQSQREWAARRAVVEFQLGKRLEFQGTGDTIIRTGEGAKDVDINQLVGQMLQGELQKTLADLLGGQAAQQANKPGWFEQASKAAAREGVSGCRVTRLQQDITTGRVTVEVHFVARLPKDKWEIISTDKVTLDANQPRKDLQDGIAKDPQVVKAIETVKGLGLPVAQSRIKLALQFGAATMEAQQTAEAQFFQRQNRYTRRLDRPPLFWP